MAVAAEVFGPMRLAPARGLVEQPAVGRPANFSGIVDRLLYEAQQAENFDPEGEAKHLYRLAGVIASDLYLRERSSTTVTARSRRARGDYGVLAVTGFMAGGDIKRAVRFANDFLEDRLVPEASRVKVREMVKPAAK